MILNFHIGLLIHPVTFQILSDDSCRHFDQKLLQNERNSYNESKYQVFEQVVVSGY